MVKRIPFVLIFVALQLCCSASIITSIVPSPENQTTKVLVCDAPPPDSFRITATNTETGTITLSWIPAWVGANHTLEVLKKATSGTWVPENTFYNVPGSLYNVPNLLYGSEYRFKIATNCTSGEPSYKTAIIDGIVLILDLVLAGRTPISPVIVEECSTIDYLAHNWVGFKVASNTGGSNPTVYNYFELGTSGDVGSQKVQIKRVIYGPRILASDEIFNFPKIPFPLKVMIFDKTFKVFELIGVNKYTIGYLTVYFNEINHTFKICKDPNHDWDNHYTFEMLTAVSANGFLSPENSERLDLTSKTSKNFTVQSPIKDRLNIFIAGIPLGKGSIMIQLLNLRGQTVFEQDFNSDSDKMSIPVAFLPAGLYILRIETAGQVQSIKIVKPE